jgi:hypothetical protein
MTLFDLVENIFPRRLAVAVALVKSSFGEKCVTYDFTFFLIDATTGEWPDMPPRKLRRDASSHLEQPRVYGRNSSRSPGSQTRGRISFWAVDLKRVVKALQAVGISPDRVEINTDGKIVVIASGTGTSTTDDTLDRWIESHASSA